MRIALITVFYNANYGAVLQAYRQNIGNIKTRMLLWIMKTNYKYV